MSILLAGVVTPTINGFQILGSVPTNTYIDFAFAQEDTAGDETEDTAGDETEDTAGDETEDTANNLGQEVSEFVHKSRDQFSAQKEETKAIINSCREAFKNAAPEELQDIKKQCREDLNQVKESYQELRHTYHDVFKQFRDHVKAIISGDDSTDEIDTINSQTQQNESTDKIHDLRMQMQVELKPEIDDLRKQMKAEREKMREEMQNLREKGGDKLKEEEQSMREKMKQENEKIKEQMKTEREKIKEQMKAEREKMRDQMKDEQEKKKEIILYIERVVDPSAFSQTFVKIDENSVRENPLLAEAISIVDAMQKESLGYEGGPKMSMPFVPIYNTAINESDFVTLQKNIQFDEEKVVDREGNTVSTHKSYIEFQDNAYILTVVVKTPLPSPTQ